MQERSSTRYIDGHKVAYQRYRVHYLDGRTAETSVSVWNPEHPERRVNLSPDVFDAISTTIDPDEARSTINTEGREHTLVIYFTGRFGKPRRMVCRYFGAASTHTHLMRVWDIEKQGIRTINLYTTRRIVITAVDRKKAA